MDFLTRTFIRVREFHKALSKGQTMVEYAFILSCVALVAFATFQVMGGDITWVTKRVNFVLVHRRLPDFGD